MNLNLNKKEKFKHAISLSIIYLCGAFQVEEEGARGGLVGVAIAFHIVME